MQTFPQSNALDFSEGLKSSHNNYAKQILGEQIAKANLEYMKLEETRKLVQQQLEKVKLERDALVADYEEKKKKIDRNVDRAKQLELSPVANIIKSINERLKALDEQLKNSHTNFGSLMLKLENLKKDMQHIKKNMPFNSTTTVNNIKKQNILSADLQQQFEDGVNRRQAEQKEREQKAEEMFVESLEKTPNELRPQPTKESIAQQRTVREEMNVIFELAIALQQQLKLAPIPAYFRAIKEVKNARDEELREDQQYSFIANKVKEVEKEIKQEQLQTKNILEQIDSVLSQIGNTKTEFLALIVDAVSNPSQNIQQPEQSFKL